MSSPNLAASMPLFRMVERDLTSRILRGEYPKGSRLPSEAQLVQTLGVSRQTVNKAVRELAKQGLVERNKRAGTVVSRAFHGRFVLPLFDVSEDVKKRGGTYHFELIERLVCANDSQAAVWSELGHEAAIVAVELLHFADGLPVLHEQRYINIAVAPEVEQQNFEHTAPSIWLLQNVPWSSVMHRITATNCAASLAAKLQIAPGTACVVIERRTFHIDAPVTLVRYTLAGQRFDIQGDFSLPTL